MLTLHSRDSGKIVNAEEAVRLIREGDTVATGGFVGIGFAEEIAVALEALYLSKEKQIPQRMASRAISRWFTPLARAMAKSVGSTISAMKDWCGASIGGHWGLVPKLQQLAIDNKIEAYNFPQGVISHLFRDIAAKRPGHLTQVGLGTFVDPRHGGGKINECTKEDLVRLIEVDGEEFLFYRAFPINIGIIRAPPPIPTAMSPWKRRRSPLKCWRLPWRYEIPAAWSSCRSSE